MSKKNCEDLKTALFTFFSWIASSSKKSGPNYLTLGRGIIGSCQGASEVELVWPGEGGVKNSLAKKVYLGD